MRMDDVLRNKNTYQNERNGKADARSLAAYSGLSREERLRLALIPEAEWERMVVIVTRMRDEMEASGKYRLSEIGQVQMAVCIIGDPLTRPELRAAAMDRVFHMFERENPPENADTSEAAVDEAALKDSSTVSLLKKLKGGGGTP
jgi:hypothetical protein